LRVAGRLQHAVLARGDEHRLGRDPDQLLDEQRGSTKPGGEGSSDHYVTTRERLNGC
jgi:hypothetical protein